jgi:hypothetical protein
MRTRTKHEKLEKQRKTFFMIGAILALAVVFTAFEWRTYDVSYDLDLTNHGWDVFEEEPIDATKQEKKELPEVKLKPVVVIKEVDNDQEVPNVELKRGLGAGLDEIAMKVVKDMPRWTPGKQRKIPVRVSMVVPINYELH